MRYNILFGGKAGQGPNVLTNLLGDALAKKGYYVFYSRDYQSLIRGGHNFNMLTFSDKPIHSNESKIDIIVALDENTLRIHKDNLKKNCIILGGKYPNMHFSGNLFKILGFEFEDLDRELKELKRKYKENVVEAKKGFEEKKCEIELKKIKGNKGKFLSGTQGIALGAVKSGLDIYYGYPMTPSTPILGELAGMQEEKNILVVEIENEIGVANAGIGSAITGAKTMIGTSGGGFDLMTESLSLMGIAEVPMVIYLAQRAGPSTGVPTYNSQGDLDIARHAGHGEFNRVVLAPGDPREAQELTNQCFYFSQKHKVPAIVLSDKHLAESYYILPQKPKIVSVGKNTKWKRYSSYEQGPNGSSTEKPELINRNVEKRIKVGKEIIKDSKKFPMYEIYGKKNSKNLVVSWGSTKGAILDSIEDLNCAFLQIKYIEPFPDIEKLLKGKNIILIENNATGLLGNLIREKTGIKIKKKILRYDGRPFLSDELEKDIRGNLK